MRFGGKWFEKKEGMRGSTYEITDVVYDVVTVPCEVLVRSAREILVRKGEAPTMVREERKGKVVDIEGVSGAQVEAVRRVMSRGLLECASDGSVMGGKSAVAVWFGVRDEEEGVMISREVKGYPHDSGRAELDGPVMALEVLKKIEDDYGETCDAKLWIDNAEVVELSRCDRLKLLPSRSCGRNVDMLLHKRHLQESYGGKVEVKKVKAHQDDEGKYEELPYKAKKNVDCDGVAKVEVVEATGNEYLERIPDGVEAMLWTRWGGLTRDPYNWVMIGKAEGAVKKRLKLNDRAYSRIDWEIHGQVLARVQPESRASVKRMVWDELPNQVKLCRNGYAEDEMCRLCKNTVDKTRHYLECGDTKLKRDRERIIGNLKARMRGVSLNPFLSHWILEAIAGRSPRMEKVKPLALERRVTVAFDEQNSIGWQQLLKGRTTTRMVELQRWWDRENGTGKLKTRDAKAVVVNALGTSVIMVYEIWKKRCERVMEVALPAKKEKLIREVKELINDVGMVEARDGFLFDDRHRPKGEDTEQVIGDWITSVRLSAKRLQMKNSRVMQCIITVN